MSFGKDAAITIHHIEGRRSFRVIWLCEELAIPYRLAFKVGDVLGSLVAMRNAFPSMPMSPVVHYDGEYIVESGAILEILVARHGNGRLAPPSDSKDFLFHQQWMHFAEATLMARMGIERFIAMSTGVDVDKVPRGWTRSMPIDAPMMVGSVGVFDFVEEYLSEHAYFGGNEFSAADIMMQYAVRGAKLVVWIDSADYPHIAAWRRKVESRPAFERAAKAALPGGADEHGLPLGQPLPFPPPPPRGT